MRRSWTASHVRSAACGTSRVTDNNRSDSMVETDNRCVCLHRATVSVSGVVG